MIRKQKIPWKEMFRYAVQVSKVPPKDFWDMTMKEFICLTNVSSNDSMISKDDLEHMIKHFN